MRRCSGDWPTRRWHCFQICPGLPSLSQKEASCPLCPMFALRVRRDRRRIARFFHAAASILLLCLPKPRSSPFMAKMDPLHLIPLRILDKLNFLAHKKTCSVTACNYDVPFSQMGMAADSITRQTRQPNHRFPLAAGQIRIRREEAVLGQTKRFLRGCKNFLPALA